MLGRFSDGVAHWKASMDASIRSGKRAKNASRSSSWGMSSGTFQLGFRGRENVIFGVTNTVRKGERSRSMTSSSALDAEAEALDTGGAGADSV